MTQKQIKINIEIKKEITRTEMKEMKRTIRTQGIINIGKKVMDQIKMNKMDENNSIKINKYIKKT